jgi:putative thiamine transport system ATP-binding protein
VFDHIRARAIPALLVTHDIGDAEATGGAVVTL